MTFGSIFLINVYNTRIFYISLIIAFIQVGGGILRIILGIIDDKHRNRIQLLYLTVYIIVVATAVSQLLFDKNMYTIVLMLIIIGIVANGWHGIVYTEIATSAGIDYSGRAIAMMGMVIFTVSFVTRYIIPYILSFSSWSIVWGMFGMVPLGTLMILKKDKEEKNDSNAI